MKNRFHPITLADLHSALARIRRAGGLLPRVATQDAFASAIAVRRGGYTPAGHLAALLERVS